MSLFHPSDPEDSLVSSSPIWSPGSAMFCTMCATYIDPPSGRKHFEQGIIDHLPLQCNAKTVGIVLLERMNGRGRAGSPPRTPFLR